MWRETKTNRRLDGHLDKLALAYALIVALLALLLHGFTDRLWLGTLLAYAPRWPLAVPALFLAPAALALGRRHAAAGAALAGILALGPYMGICVPLSRASGEAEAPALRIATWNAAGRQPHDPVLGQALAALDADVVGVTECRAADVEERSQLHGFSVATVYGFCLFSKLPILEVDNRSPRDAWEREGSGIVVRYVLELAGRRIHVVGVHLETVRGGLSGLRHGSLSALEDNIALRRWESEIARAWTERADGPLIVLGDFNLPVESDIYAASWSHLTNAFDACGFGYGHTKRTRWHGVRIDHILTNDAWRCRDAEVGDGAWSDHDPLAATLILQ